MSNEGISVSQTSLVNDVQSTLDKPPPFVFIKSWHYSEFGGESNSCLKTKCIVCESYLPFA
jgi:hypothetical protein